MLRIILITIFLISISLKANAQRKLSDYCQLDTIIDITLDLEIRHPVSSFTHGVLNDEVIYLKRILEKEKKGFKIQGFKFNLNTYKYQPIEIHFDHRKNLAVDRLEYIYFQQDFLIVNIGDHLLRFRESSLNDYELVESYKVQNVMGGIHSYQDATYYARLGFFHRLESKRDNGIFLLKSDGSDSTIMDLENLAFAFTSIRPSNYILFKDSMYFLIDPVRYHWTVFNMNNSKVIEFQNVPLSWKSISERDIDLIDNFHETIDVIEYIMDKAEGKSRIWEIGFLSDHQIMVKYQMPDPEKSLHFYYDIWKFDQNFQLELSQQGLDSKTDKLGDKILSKENFPLTLMSLGNHSIFHQSKVLNLIEDNEADYRGMKYDEYFNPMTGKQLKLQIFDINFSNQKSQP